MEVFSKAAIPTPKQSGSVAVGSDAQGAVRRAAMMPRWAYGFWQSRQRYNTAEDSLGALAGSSEGAKRAGCDSFVTKPCLPDDLVVEVKRMLNAVKQG